MSLPYTCAHTVLPSVWYQRCSLGHLSLQPEASLCTHPSVHMAASSAAASSCILMPSTVRRAHRSEKQLPLFVYFAINKAPVYQTL